MNVNYKKTLKLVTLLAMSLLIATVAAETYRYMYLDGSVTISSSKMLWLTGADAPGDASIDGSTVTVDLDVEAGTPINFTECLFLKNDNTTGSFSIDLSITPAVSGSDFSTCKVHIYENSTGTWTYVDTLDLTNAADTYSGSLAAGNYLRMTFDVDAATGASGTKPFDMQVRYN
jgi:hypothetical protein